MKLDEELTLKKLQLFLSFMRCGSIAKAAQEQNLSNVSIHKAIRSLENSLRCPLFKREGRHLIPLKSAYVLEEEVHAMMNHLHTSIIKTREAAGFASKVLRLGALYSLTVNTLPRIIQGLKIRQDQLDIQLLLSSNADLLKKLQSTELDAILIALDETTTQESFEQQPIFTDSIYLAVNKNSPLARQDTVNLSTLQHASFLSLSPGFATRQDSDKVFERAGISPNFFLEVSDIFTLVSMISSDLGIALLPGRMSSFYESSVKLLTLPKEHQIEQQIGLVFLKNRERDPNILALLAECRMFAKHPNRQPPS